MAKTFAEKLDHDPTAQEWLEHLESRIHDLELAVKKLDTASSHDEPPKKK